MAFHLLTELSENILCLTSTLAFDSPSALARLLASQAPLWVLDEPFVALDTKAVDGLRGLLAEHVAQGGMVLFTSHQPVTLATTAGVAVDVQHYRLRGVA